MFIFDYIKKEDIKEHHPNWPEISIQNINSWKFLIWKNKCVS